MKIKNLKFKIKNSGKTGFTLIETLVAISIFTMSILGLMSVLSSGIADTNYAKQKILASYLAQEGIEFMRNMRDTYVLYDVVDSQTGWNDFNTKTTNASCGGAGCYFDDRNMSYSSNSQATYKSNLLLNTCGGTCPVLLYDISSGKYGYVGGTTSGFTRKISIIQVSADEIKVSSTVSWTQGSGNYSIVFSESLFNWIE